MSEQTWSKTINVAGAGVRGPGTGFQEPPTGAYKVKIIKTLPYEKDGVVASVRFDTQITEGDHAGTELRVFIGLDTDKAGNRTSWRTAMLSCGYTPGQIDAGDVNIGPSTFEGRDGFCYFKARDPNGATSQSDRRFITEEAYSSLMGEATTAAPSKAASAAKPAATTVPSVNVATKPASAGGLRSMLGK